MPTLSRPWNRFNDMAMRNILALLLLALPFVSLNAQVQAEAEKDTAKVVKRMQLKMMDNSEMKAIGVDNEETKKSAPNATKAKKENQAVTNVSANRSKATFPGGERAIRDFVRKNVRYPEECKQERNAGRAVVSITVKPDGTLSGFAIKNSSGNKYMDAEALRIARLMPKWTPAADTGKGVEFKYLLNVSFRPGR